MFLAAALFLVVSWFKLNGVRYALTAYGPVLLILSIVLTLRQPGCRTEGLAVPVDPNAQTSRRPCRLTAIPLGIPRPRESVDRYPGHAWQPGEQKSGV